MRLMKALLCKTLSVNMMHCVYVCNVICWPLRYGEVAWLCEGWTITDCVDDEMKGGCGQTNYATGTTKYR